MNCTEVHLQIGAAPQASTPELEAHLCECAACAAYRREMLELDAQILQALKIDPAVLERDAPGADVVPGDILKNEGASQPAARLVPSSPPVPENSSWAASMARQWALAASVLLAV